MPIHWDRVTGPVFLPGSEDIANRDPAGHFHDGLFRVFHTRVQREGSREFYAYTAVTVSRDLIDWSEPRILTPRNPRLNYSSPGNVVRFGSRWLLCLQTYPSTDGRPRGDDTARIHLMPSDDLENWGEPVLLKVKGPDVPVDEMVTNDRCLSRSG